MVLRLTGRRIAPPRRPRAQECEALLGPPPEEGRRPSSGQGTLRIPPPSPGGVPPGKGHGPGRAARSRAPHREGVYDPLPAFFFLVAPPPLWGGTPKKKNGAPRAASGGPEGLIRSGRSPLPTNRNANAPVVRKVLFHLFKK